MKSMFFLHQYFAFVIILLVESFGRVNFSSLTISTWNLSTCFYSLANYPLQPQKRHYNGPVVCKLPHSNCNV